MKSSIKEFLTKLLATVTFAIITAFVLIMVFLAIRTIAKGLTTKDKVTVAPTYYNAIELYEDDGDCYETEKIEAYSIDDNGNVEVKIEGEWYYVGGFKYVLSHKEW